MSNLQRIKPLSGRGEDIIYERNNEGICIGWAQIRFRVSNENINDILDKFFIDINKWYLLGADMVSPSKGGLGEFVRNNIPNLSPRHASAIATVMVNEGLIIFKGNKPIELKKISQQVLL